MHIKTYILTLLLLCLSMPALAQGDALFDEFKRERNAEYIKIPAIVTAMGKLFMGNESEEQFAKKVRTVRVLDMEKCSAGVKRRFDRRVAALVHKGYETMVRVNDDGEKVHIYARIKNKVIRELLIACSEEKDCTLVQIKGRFNRDDIARVVNEQTGHKHGHH